MSNYETMSDELMGAMRSIWGNERYRSNERRMRRCVDAWKEICSRYLSQASDPYDYNVTLAFMNAVTYKIYNMDYERSIEFITNVCNTMREV